MGEISLALQSIMGNDHVVIESAIFSAAVGVKVSSQANTLPEVQCYKEVTGWGGLGIYLRVPGLPQT